MASPNTTFVAGNILTAAQMNNLPFGLIARISTTPAQTVTTVADMTGVSITWTPPSSSRVYLIIANLELFNQNSGSLADLQIADGSNVSKQTNSLYIPLAGTQTMVMFSVVETGLSGSTTRKIRFGRGFGNTGDVTTFGDQQLTVIDIGSV